MSFLTSTMTTWAVTPPCASRMAAGSPPTTCRFASSVQAFGNHRGAAPTQTVTNRDFTGQPQNRAVGLLYYQARFYVPGIGRFASADTLVPDPADPQQYNRYSYSLNNPVRYTDPTGHSCYNPSLGSPCVLSDGAGNSSSLPHPVTPKKDPYEPPSNMLTHLPLERSVITGQSGFGPNWYATYHCNQACYGASSNIHTGLDFFAPAGSTVYTTVSGEIVVIYQGDANPNVVIKITVGSTTYYVIHGHIEIDEAIRGRIAAGEKVEVTAGAIIGTLQDQGANSHVHLGTECFNDFETTQAGI